MRKSKGPYVVKRKADAGGRSRRWLCVDKRDGSVVSEHFRKSNARDVAGLSNSIAEKYGEVWS